VIIEQPEYRSVFTGDGCERMIAVAIERWRFAVDHLESNDWVTPGRLAVADRYARAYAEYEALYPIAASEGPVKIGPNGGDLFNFNWSAVEKLNERLAKLEAKLKIDPDGDASGSVSKAPKTKADDYLDG